MTVSRTGRYEIGASNRQAVLDFMHSQDRDTGFFASEIADALSINQAVMSKRLMVMSDIGELRRERIIRHGVNAVGVHYSQLTYIYWPLTRNTQNLNPAADRYQGDHPQQQNRITRNTNPNRPCIKNQGGQGYNVSAWQRLQSAY